MNEFIKLWGRSRIPVVSKNDGKRFKTEQTEIKIMHLNELFRRAGYESLEI
jgi:hypothetical protein